METELISGKYVRNEGVVSREYEIEEALEDYKKLVAYLSDFYGPPEAYSLNYYDENNMFQRKLTDSIDAFIELDASSASTGWNPPTGQSFGSVILVLYDYGEIVVQFKVDSALL
jgi:hypothetical protein